MAKRKVDTENRGFQTRWESEYMFTEVAGKPVCLLCGESVAVLKEYNLRRHYETKHADKNKNMDMEQRLQKAEELKRGVKSRQALFKKAKSQGQAAVKASFILAEEIAKSARPFTEGDFIKNCMIKVCDEVCPEKRQLFLNVSLSRNTIAERVDQLSINLKEQLVKKGKDFIAYSLAVDESTDISDIAQLSIFIRGVDSSLSVTEEFLALRPMHGTTTGHDLYEEVSRCVNEMELPWEKLVGLTTDGAPAMCGHRSGLVAKIREKMQEENATGELTAYHCIIHQEALCGKALKMEHVMSIITRTVNFIRAKGLNHRQFKAFLTELETEHGDLPYHTEVRWLSQGKVLQRCFELREEICLFLDSKGKDTTQLRDEMFLCEMAFLCDITSHLNAMNLQLQGRDHVISDMYSTVKAFKTKLTLWETQMRKENLSHFPSCQTMKEKLSTSAFPSAQLADKIGMLAADFRRRFADFEAQKSRLELLGNPFAVDVESSPPNLQMELIDLQCNDALRAKYAAVGAAEFARFLPDTMPQLRIQAAQTLSMFGSTYLCEQLFSLMNLNKTSHRSRLTAEHLHSILRISSAQSLTPNIDELVEKMGHHQVSPSTSNK
ncbi:general transcription factor II-I repeat domain-containing protein 2-like [Salvelinus fontinalis]|uniref:general transcription factor II-I repeat domain-containing protein 2-like n=1 Tax=Salvelinus fontinalis TaxID=8038 RepID=UPI002485527B|nr:general transcription factor II-I repeat domain-containing protein 2-like [Salvelinus fontinalis]